VDPGWERDAPDAYPCRAVITTTSGERFERAVAYAPGHARNPMDLAGVTTKFRTNVANLVPDARAEETIAAVMSVDDLASIRDLTAVLRG
jgi:2-methylcitrate dehydratase PrpD